MPFTHFWNNKINDLFFSVADSQTNPLTGGLWVAFYSTTPTIIGTDGTELTATGGYLRQRATDTKFGASASSAIQNDVSGEISWGAASANYNADIVAVVFLDAQTIATGNNCGYHTIAAKTVTTDDTAKILDNNLTLTMS